MTDGGSFEPGGPETRVKALKVKLLEYHGLLASPLCALFDSPQRKGQSASGTLVFPNRADSQFQMDISI